MKMDDLSTNRRAFLSGIGAGALLPMLDARKSTAQAAEYGPVSGEQRREQAYQIRLQMAGEKKNFPVPEHLANGDEESFPFKIANYSKGLPHNARGEVYLDAYSQLVTALSSGRAADFESISMGCPDVAKRRKLVNPQAGLAFELEGIDSHQLGIPPPPAFSSAQQAGEAIELYWMALARDVPFSEYGS